MKISILAPFALGAVVALSACGGTTPPPQPPVAQPETGHGPHAEHRARVHHGGVAMLIALSIRELDLTADQKAKVEQIRTDLHAKLEPAHAAGKELSGVLADGVAAGAVDRAKADAAIEKLVGAVEQIQAATQDALNQLHAALTPAQRAQLVDKVQARAAKWHEEHGDDGHAGAHHGPPRQGGFGHDLGLTDDQKEKIRANLKAMMPQGGPGGGSGGGDGHGAGGSGGGGGPGAGGGHGPGGHDHHEMEEHMQAFATAFKSDTFDAKTLGPGGGRAAGHMARFGATHMARWCEAAAPVLTPEQRTKLSASIRDHGSQGHGPQK